MFAYKAGALSSVCQKEFNFWQGGFGKACVALCTAQLNSRSVNNTATVLLFQLAGAQCHLRQYWASLGPLSISRRYVLVLSLRHVQ